MRESIEAVIERTLTEKPEHPDPQDVLRLYLELPRVIHNEDPPTKLRSSFEAALADAEAASKAGRDGIHWLAAIGYLVFLEQVGKVLRLNDVQAEGENDVEIALHLFSKVAQPQRVAVYALRCALAHDFGLINKGIEKRWKAKSPDPLRHYFVLTLRGPGPVITLPSTPWNGGLQDIPESQKTTIHLGRLADLVRSVRDRVLEHHAARNLSFSEDLTAAEVRSRFFFVHDVDIQEWLDQQEQEGGEYENLGVDQAPVSESGN